LEVLLMGDDDVPLELTEVDRWGGSVMARLEDGWCAALDRDTMLCRIYERRPAVCRDYQVGESDCIAQRSTLDTESKAAGRSVENITWWLPDGTAREL
jgi:Fe-S-cluster containining protein